METLNEYIRAVIEYTSYPWNDNPEIVNSAHDKIIAAFKKLKKNNELSHLKELINHENKGVVLWASTHLLIVDENLALQNLEKILKEKEQYSFSAEMVIREWKSGRLNLEYPNIK